MAETFTVEILSPARAVYTGEAEMVIIPGAEGQFTAMPRHAPMLSSLGMDILSVVANGKKTDFFVSNGTVDVTPQSVTILADEAIAVADIRADEINARLISANEVLAAAASPSQREHANKTIVKLNAMKALVAA